MTSLAMFEDLGLDVALSPNGKIRLKGLSGIAEEKARRVVEFAREHKQAIISELSRKTLPTTCPLLTGIVPKACRFEPKFFQRMIKEGVLPLNGGCPIQRVCKLYQQQSGRSLDEN